MSSIVHAVHTAAGAFLQIAELESGERGRRAAVVALVLGAVERVWEDAEGSGFVHCRAATEIASLPDAAERSHLQRLLLLAAEGCDASAPEGLGDALVEYAYELETTQRLPEADAVLSLARSAVPEDAETALHAGRIARRMRDPERALELYRTARELDASGGSIARLAAIGEAVVSADAERALSRAYRCAVRAGDAEAAAVALEERARVRHAAGQRRAAARDLCFAATRYVDPIDRARVAHRLADLFVAAGDPLAAREALLLALAVGDGSQRDHALSRLHTVSRDLGDQVGMRRWRSFTRPALVSLSVRPSSSSTTDAPRIARWRESVSATACTLA